jgi:hypothetical protein
MQPWRNKLLLLGGVAALGIAIPALSQETPESLLPPGFEDPETVQQPEANNTVSPTPAPAATPRTDSDAAPRAAAELDAVVESATAEDLEALEALPPEPPVEIPDFARRGTDVVGFIGPGEWGLEQDAFGTANGRFLSTLMRRLDAPLPSRWMSILLRRALSSRVVAPSSVNPVDFVAERAWLLLRMGEADAARMLVQSVDVDRFTPKMFQIAVQTALATADPAALCPLVGPGREVSDEQVWPLADAMCASLAGDAARASTLIGQARRRSGLDPIDITLAEKVVGAGANTRRAVTVQWDDVDALNSWRFGIAASTGVEIPDALRRDAGAHVRAWEARAPMLPLASRVNAAQVAASLGVFSNHSLVEIFSLLSDDADPSEFRQTVGGRLQAAYASRSIRNRMNALRDLWDDGGNDPVMRHARLILTAGAAAGIPPSQELAEDAPELIAAMLTAGSDRNAARWTGVAAAMEGQDADRVWSMLALASPNPGVEISAGRIGTFQGNDESAEQVRTKLLFAALAGLDRLQGAGDIAEDVGVNLALQNRWTRLIDRAAERRQQGTVVLLAAAGMQTGGWAGVPPENLYRIVSALRRVGLEYEARMIAAEALARL